MLFRSSYIDQVLSKYSMQNSKKGFVPFRVGKSLLSSQRPKTSAEVEKMRGIPYASVVGSLMYAMLRTRPDICFVVGMVSRYQSELLGMETTSHAYYLLSMAQSFNTLIKLSFSS